MRLYIASLGLAAVVLTIGCTKKVDEIAPVNLIEAQTGITDSVTAERAVLGIYSGLQASNHYGLIWPAYTDLYTDGIRFSGTFTTHGEVRDKVITPSNLQINNTWQTLYGTIGRANWLIDKVQSLPLTTATRDRMIAEARFVRGIVYFDLVKAFGGVPIVTIPTQTKDSINFVPRSSVSEVYTHIVNDLRFAETALPTTSVATRGSKAAAAALLARVYLQNGDHTNAAAKATEVINSNRFSLQGSYADIFIRENSPETIFAISFTINDQNGLAAATNPAVGGQKFYATAGLVTAFANAGDSIRRANTVRVISGINTMAKYGKFASSDDDFQFIRLAEMFLIRAEALVRADAGSATPATQAITDINRIRNRAGLASVTPVTNAAALTEIYLQRRLEFAHEAHRFFDLQRNGGPFAGANAFRNLWPIPTLQRQYNPALTQNPGYE